MTTRKYYAAGAATLLCLCALAIALFGRWLPLQRALRSLAGAEDVITDSATRTEGDWQVTPVGRLRFSHHFPEQDRLLLASERMRPELWDTKKGKRVAVLRDCTEGIGTAALSPGGERFVTGDRLDHYFRRDGERAVHSLRVWETPTGKLLKTIDIDLSGGGAKDTTDWQAFWWDRRTLLVQLYCRQNPARASVGTAFARVDVERGKVVKLSERLDVSEDLTLSPDRKRAAAARQYGVYRGDDGGIGRGGRGTTYTVGLVDMDALTLVAQLEAGEGGKAREPNALWSVTWSPDSRWLAAAAADHTVRVWDGRDGRPVATLKGHTDWVLDLGFSPDGRTLLTASDDDTARLWDVKSGKLLHILTGHTAGLTPAAFDPTGTRVLTGGEDQTARLWDAATGKQLRVWPDHESGVREAEFAAGGKEVRTRTARGVERVWSVADGKLVSEKKPKKHVRDRYGVCLLRESGEDTEVWVGPPDAVPPPLPDDGRRRIHLGPSGEDPEKDLTPARLVLRGHKHWVTGAAVAPDGKSVASSSQDKTTRVWDAAGWDRVTGKGRVTLPHAEEVNCVAFAPDGKALATGDDAGVVRLWDRATGKALWTTPVRDKRVKALAFTPDGKTLIAAVGKTVALLDAAKGEERKALRGLTAWADGLAVTADGKTLAVGSYVREGYSDEGNQAERPGEVLLWDLGAGKELRRLKGHTGGVEALGFTPDGKALATAGGFDKTVILWDVAAGKERAVLKGHAEPIRSLAVTPDGKAVASGDWSGTIKMWDVVTGKERLSFRGHLGWVTSLAFTRDGETLVSGGSDQTVKLWDLKKMLPKGADK
jgi:WD40 repeat protein